MSLSSSIVTRQICNDCGNLYSNLKQLIQHQKAVCHKVTFPCNYCARYFRRNDTLQHHLQKYHSIQGVNNAFKCARDGCLFKTHKAHLLKAHLQKFHPDAKEIQDVVFIDPKRDYRCPHSWCGKRFKNQFSLAGHQTRCLKGGVKYCYLCHICNKMTITSVSWVKVENDPVVCKSCRGGQKLKEHENTTINENGFLFKVAVKNYPKNGKRANGTHQSRSRSRIETEGVNSSESVTRTVLRSPLEEFLHNLGLVRVENPQLGNIPVVDEPATSPPDLSPLHLETELSPDTISEPLESSLTIPSITATPNCYKAPSAPPPSPIAVPLLSPPPPTEKSSLIHNASSPPYSETFSPTPVVNPQSFQPSNGASPLPLIMASETPPVSPSSSPPPDLIDLIPMHQSLSTIIPSLLTQPPISEPTVSPPLNLRRPLKRSISPKANASKPTTAVLQDSSPQLKLTENTTVSTQSLSIESPPPPDFLEKLGLIPVTTPCGTSAVKVVKRSSPSQIKRVQTLSVVTRRQSSKRISTLSITPVMSSSQEMFPFSKRPSSSSFKKVIQPPKLSLTFHPTPPFRKNFLSMSKSPLHRMKKPPISHSFPIEKSLQISSLPQLEISPISHPLHVEKSLQMSSLPLPQIEISSTSCSHNRSICHTSSPLSNVLEISRIEPKVNAAKTSLENIVSIDPLPDQQLTLKDAATEGEIHSMKILAKHFSSGGLSSLLAGLDSHVEEYPF